MNWLNSIIYLISTELVKRFELDSGKMKYMVKNDPEVIEAVTLLGDATRYNGILGKKGE